MYNLKKKMKLAILLAIFFAFKANAQNFRSKLKKIEVQTQKCLDTGKFMYGCSKKYYYQVDSLLNVVYKHIKKGLTPKEQSELKRKQLNWLKKRDFKFQKINSEDTGFGSGFLDDLMVKTEEKAKIVSERVNYLIDKFIEKNNSKITGNQRQDRIIKNCTQ